MKTLLMRAWRRFGAYGLALAAALATAWAVREHVGQGEPEPVAANAPVVERLVAAEDLAAGTRLDESHLQRRQVPAAWAPRASLDPLAAQALRRGAVSGYRCGRDHPAGTSAGPTRRAGVDGACGGIASRNARLECDRRRSRAVGWPAARGRQRRRLRILCPRRQAQRRSGAVGGGSCPSARRPTMARRTRRTPCWRSARGCPALRRSPTGRHPDGHAASPGRRGGRGRRGSGRSGRLAGHARRILRRAALSFSTETGRMAGRRAARRPIRRRGRRGAAWR